ncbi:SpoIIE family protein phosphatase [Streptomyces carpinensis]|uniref:SpoIIE family protein phosphatase n=1 Tax=Streptomyces carpinensis TaxID=66369 RepID=UPI001FC9583E|nr:SpoIIE family protein phosphatase [Streptomyces carpinensis]
MDREGTVCLWSPQVQALLGYSADEVCGRSAADLLVGQEARKAVRAARERYWAGECWDGVLAMRHRDGHQVQIALRVRPLLGRQGPVGWSVAAADAQHVEQAHVDRAILQALFRQSPISITILDTDLRYWRVNAAVERDAAVPAERLIGRHIGDRAPGVDFQAIEKVLRQVRDTGKPVVGFQFRGRTPADPEHEHMWSGSSFRLTDPAGRVLGMCQTYIDITDGWRAQRRLTLLTEAGTRIGTSLDVVRTAQELADTAVPDFADVIAVDLLEATVHGDEPHPEPLGDQWRLRRAGIRSIQGGDPAAAHALGESVAVRPGTPQHRCLAGGNSLLLQTPDADEWATFDTRTAERIHTFEVHSLMEVPLRARGITLGVATFGRYRDPQPYDEVDLALAEDFCSRAAVSIDNARRYTREHNTAIALQRSLLPHHVPHYPAIESAHRYLPAAAHAGAGGDWFDVLPLSGARVALVIGDVCGHGLHAAAIMGRLRTAVHTLTDLDLDPDEVLTQLDDLVIRLTAEDAGCEGATCLYAVYDPISRLCTFARAGHPPPALVQPDGTVEFLNDIPPGPPLGVGGLPFETSQRHLAEGTVLVLYTNGLVQAPGQSIAAGLDRLAGSLAGPGRPLEQLCDRIATTLLPEHRPDDVALLLARTHTLADEQVACWELPVDPARVGHARALTMRQLDDWGLEPLTFTSELIISELVTNAIRYAHGPITLRLINADSLICEVSDGSLSAPHLRRARTNDEGGRGLFLVAQLASRWGTRYHRDGKTIWAEQTVCPQPRGCSAPP